MARRPTGARRGPGGAMRNRIYIVGGVIAAVVVIVVLYSIDPFGGTGRTSPGDVNDANVPYSDIPEVNEANISAPIPPLFEPNTAIVKVEPPSDTQANPQAADLIAEAMNLISADPSRVIEVRDKLGEVMLMPMSLQQRALVKSQLSELSQKWLFSRTVFPGDRLCATYKVQPGDQLRTIGKQYKVPYEILMEINHITRPELLPAGGTIKVINGPFHAKVYRSAFMMDLYLQNTYVMSFPVGLGKPGMETPTGLWMVKLGGKLVKPVWTDPVSSKTYHPEDPDYPLGSRWIALEGKEGEAKDRAGFAIHGTKDPEQIGTAGSQGCIRLRNGSAILVYNLLEPGESFLRVED